MLNIHLFEFTGESKYFNEAEKTLINSVYGHQDTDGYSFCYYTSPNEKLPAYGPFIHCCASSLPRGMEMYSNNLIGKIDKNLSLNTLFSFAGKISSEFGGGTIETKSNFPFGNETNISLNLDNEKEFVLEFRIPKNTVLKKVKINNVEINSKKNDRGQFEVKRYWGKNDQINILKANLINADKNYFTLPNFFGKKVLKKIFQTLFMIFSDKNYYYKTLEWKKNHYLGNDHDLGN